LCAACREIDALAAQLQAMRRPAEGDGAQQEDAAASSSASDAAASALAQLKEAKKRYRERYDKLAEKRAEVQYLVRVKEQVLQRMAVDFQQWLAAQRPVQQS
jgi:hypothetical protein